MKNSSVLLITLLLALGLCLSACGNNNQPDGNNEHVHSFGDWEITHKPTCAQSGAKVRYCDCGEKQTEVVPATDLHTEVIDKAVAPTCTEAGLTEGKHCSVCELVIVGQEVIDPTGHTEVTDVAVAPTCTETGLTEGKHCSVCNEVLVKQGVDPIIPHTYTDKYDESCNVCGNIRDAECAHGEIDVIVGYAATCTAPGLTDGEKCKKCGEVLTSQSVISAKGHTEVTDIAIAPTCSYTGLTEGKHCSVCNEILVKQGVIPSLPHVYGNWVVTKIANCGQDGEMARYCSCGNKQTEIIIGTGMHTEFIDKAVAPTCSSTGLTEGKHCAYCGTVLVQQDVIPALEHVFATTYSFDNSFHWYSCTGCDEIKDKVEHQVADDGMCTVCDQPIGDTVGVVYDVSNDGTYALVVGYTGTATKIRIAESYQVLPVTTIYNKAFDSNKSITSVIIPDSVTTIGNYAFNDCSKLTSVVIGDSVTTIGDYAFSYCSKLTSVVIPDSVTTIGREAFWECSNLTSVVIPDSVTTIGERAFYSCDNLTSVVIPDSVTDFGNNVFNGTKVQFNEYENCKYLGSGDNPYCYLVEATTKNLSSYKIHEDTKIIAASTFSSCSRLTSIEIPDSVTTIGERAFQECSSLASVVIGDSVTTIGDYAFACCDNLTSVVIPDSVTTIGYQAFYDCNNLTSVVIGDSVTTIGFEAFRSCSNLTSVVIGNSVTTIGNYAFYTCSKLTSVVIPDSVTTIGYRAFYSCSKLKDVYYTGSEEEWKAITIGSDNSNLTYATRHYNYIPE